MPARPWHDACCAQPMLEWTSAVSPRRGRVLVVEDHPLVGPALMDSLACDHDAVLETTARDALQRLSSGERFDVVLCDLTLPLVDGIDLYFALHELDPETARRVVFMTGGPCGTRAEEFIRSTRNKVLKKPFEMELLLAVIAARVGSESVHEAYWRSEDAAPGAVG